MSKSKTPSVAELRKQAEAAGIDVPAKATKAQITKLLEHKTVPSESAGTQDKAGSPSEQTIPAPTGTKTAGGNVKVETSTTKKETVAKGGTSNAAKTERRKIEQINERGDWLDPFSGKTVAAGNEVNPQNQVRRDGDDAVRLVTE